MILGWLCEDEQGTLTLEGGVLHVPSLLSSMVVEMAKSLRDHRRGASGGDFRARAAELPLNLILAIMGLRERGPLPALQNMSGDALAGGHGEPLARPHERRPAKPTAGAASPAG